MKKIIHFALFLLIMSGLAGIGLYGINVLTMQRIQEAKLKDFVESQKTALPGAAVVSPALFYPSSDGSGIYYEVFNTTSNLIGYELPGVTRGYQSEVKVLTGIDTNGTIIAVKVLEQAETPGLGTRVCELGIPKSLWNTIAGLFGGAKATKAAGPAIPKFQAQYRNKTLEQLDVVKMPNPNKIEAITGATITSEAVTRAVREPLESFVAFKKLGKQN